MLKRLIFPPGALQRIVIIHQMHILVKLGRGYMVLCGSCRENVKPKTYFTWKGFIYGLGIFYLIYYVQTIPHCPNCNFPMPRNRLVFAILSQQSFVKRIKTGEFLLLSMEKAKMISNSWRSYLHHRFDASRDYAKINTHLTISHQDDGRRSS
jgi:hypothetical protein